MKPIGIYNTYIHPNAYHEVANVINSTFISEGEAVKRFEKLLQSTFQLKNCATVNSGTSALHLSLVLAGVGEGDEVILPAQTFVATGLVILQQKAIPVFADIDYETGNISVASIQQKITSKTKAIIPVHWGGYPCDMDEINALAKKNNIIVIEDAAHALGATYKGESVGNLSDFTCFSFQAIKHLTTGDGGAICTSDISHTNALIKRWFGIDRNHSSQTELGERMYNISELGFKYHLNDYAAALGIANLNGFLNRLQHRIEIATLYRKELCPINGITLFNYATDRQSAYWLFGFHVENRINFIRALKKEGITASVIHQRIDRNSVFGSVRTDLVAQEKFDKTQIHIPIHDNITLEQAGKIVAIIQKGW